MPAPRLLGIGPLVAIGALAFGGAAATLLVLTFAGFPLQPDSQLTLADDGPSPQTESALLNQGSGDVAADNVESNGELETPTLALPDPDGPEGPVESFSQTEPGSEAFEALATTGIFAGHGPTERLASFLVVDDLILTSASALNGRSSVWLAYNDEWIQTLVVGADPYTDVALLTPDRWLEPLIDASVQRAEVAAGADVRLDPLVSGMEGQENPEKWIGVVRRVDDMVTTAAGRDWFQVLTMSMPTDDSVPGSAVVAPNGNAVGMTIKSQSTLAAAIPIHTAIEVARSLRLMGRPSEAWIGVEVSTDDNGETRLVAVDPASPAAETFQPDDIIISVNGEPVPNSDYLVFVVRRAGPDVDLDVVVRRDNGLRPLKIKTATVPNG